MSDTTQQTEIIRLAEYQSPKPLAQTITALETRFTGAHNALHETLRDIYGTHLAYIVNAAPEEREKNRAVLDEACKAKQIGTNDQTTDLHKLVKLVVTVSPQLTSGYVHVFSVAQALKKTPGEFLKWLKEAGGIEAVRKKFLADGEINLKYVSGSKREKNRSDKVARRRPHNHRGRTDRCLIHPVVRMTLTTIYIGIRNMNLNTMIYPSASAESTIRMLITPGHSFPGTKRNGIILHGPFGTGKSSCAKLLPSDIEAKYSTQKPNVRYENCMAGNNGVGLIESIDKQSKGYSRSKPRLADVIQGM